MKKIAILIPTYKPGNYIDGCLDSLAAQTLDKANYNIYIGLNGSEEEYLKKIEKKLKKYELEATIYSFEKPGVSNARNKLLDLSSEDYIVFLDDDDKLSPKFLEVLKEKITKDSIVVSNVKTFGKSKKTHYLEVAYKNLKDGETSKYKSRKYFSNACAKMIPREIIGSVKFNTNLKRHEDSLFMAKISNKVKKVYKGNEEAEYLVNIREESASRSRVKKQDKIKELSYLIFCYLKLLLKGKYNFLFIMTRIVATLKHLG